MLKVFAVFCSAVATTIACSLPAQDVSDPQPVVEAQAERAEIARSRERQMRLERAAVEQCREHAARVASAKAVPALILVEGDGAALAGTVSGRMFTRRADGTCVVQACGDKQVGSASTTASGGACDAAARYVVALAGKAPRGGAIVLTDADADPNAPVPADVLEHLEGLLGRAGT